MNGSILLFVSVVFFILVGGCSQPTPVPIDDAADMPIDAELLKKAIAFQETALEKRRMRVKDLTKLKESLVFGKVPSSLTSLHEELVQRAARTQKSLDAQITYVVSEEHEAIDLIMRGESSEFRGLSLHEIELKLGDWGEVYGEFRVTRHVSDTEFYGLESFFSGDTGNPFYFDGWNIKTLSKANSNDVYKLSDGAVVTGHKTHSVDGKDIQVPILKRFSLKKLGKQIIEHRKKTRRDGSLN